MYEYILCFQQGPCLTSLLTWRSRMWGDRPWLKWWRRRKREKWRPKLRKQVLMTSHTCPYVHEFLCSEGIENNESIWKLQFSCVPLFTAVTLEVWLSMLLFLKPRKWSCNDLFFLVFSTLSGRNSQGHFVDKKVWLDKKENSQEIREPPWALCPKSCILRSFSTDSVYTSHSAWPFKLCLACFFLNKICLNILSHYNAWAFYHHFHSLY